MKQSLLKSFFSSGLQALSLQVLGVFFMGVVAYYLSVEDFGIISWANAVSMFMCTLLSFGLEQVVVRRIAASKTSNWAAAAFFVHALAGSFVTLAGVFFFAKYCTNCNEGIAYLPLFFAAQGLLFLVTPLKQFLNAKHIFTPYGVIAIFSNLLKIGVGIYLLQQNLLTIDNVAYILMGTAILELICLVAYVLTRTDFSFKFRFKAYKKLLKEAGPQYMAVLFDTSMSRADWILLGLIGTASFVETGGYSFAYRAYEIARLPIGIIAPVILNVFAKMFVGNNKMSADKQGTIRMIFNIQMFIAMLIPLTMNIVWSPGLDWLFDGKYGSVNAYEFLLLSICIPIHFVVNLLWTVTFSAKKYKAITTITIIIAISNILLNLLLIPKYGGMGSAIAYLLTTIVQVILYYRAVTVSGKLLHLPLSATVLFFLIATGTYYLCTLLQIHFMLQLILAVAIYVIVGFATGKVSKSDFVALRAYLKK